MTPASNPPDEAALRAVLQEVRDPEIGESIVDLGLVKSIRSSPQGVQVTLIPTSATCPMADVMIEDVTEALRRACPDGLPVDVQMDWDTPWSPQRLSPALKARFGW
ncbi:metal-sulfur cluster assembly factor [Caldimonas manganoxidans]|uniref:metal-sulfur cluster assembly factor n=1 Tax=Caldimonas manganoxidans TaxID=196015 RepID=UPI000360E547|nr:metal-sulfur cluster assembly factor [Caldimonas manganoxidans]